MGEKSLAAVIAAMAMCALALTAGAQQPRSASRDSATVAALEHRWLAAEHDSATLDSILARDFVHALASGQFIDRQEHISFAASHPAPAAERARFERLDVRVYGDAAIATGIVDATQGQHATSRRTVFTDVFVFRDGRWRAVSAQETPLAARR